ncbi:MAG: DUF4405 domain-containing protein [Pedosphaera sp.]|nr:DUF4405 domain-containing protein [Pedosphaera sp.]
MKTLFDWLDNRTGFRKLTREALYENVPGGSRWRYVWGSTLTFAFVIQVVTGLFLLFAYSPSTKTAWESVYYIQHEMTGGWLLRGIHHFASQAMIVLLALHLMQVVIDGAYKAPRELNFLTGIVMLLMVLGLSLTGYLLPWDQKGYWASKVVASLAGATPVVGAAIQKVIIGGSDFGHHTLTRFLAIHAGVLPGMIVLLIVVHIYLFRRHGLTPRQPVRRPDVAFWPDQVLKDSVACLAVLATILFLIVSPRLFSPDAPLGAELGAPADPSEQYSAARPEWYFLFLFQFLKYFPGDKELWGSVIIPSLVMGLVFLMPFIGKWKLGHRFNMGLLLAILIGAAGLTYLAYAEDRQKPEFQLATKQAHASAERAVALARLRGIPESGALTLLREDPLTQGPKIFARSCASCHRYDGHDGMGATPSDAASAADLKGFGSHEWLAGILDPGHVAASNYFGGTKFKDGKMVRFVKKDIARFDARQKEHLNKVVMAVSAEAGLKSQAGADSRDTTAIEEGRRLFAISEMRCAECHQFRKKDEDATAPDLTGFGSREWLISFISDPAHERFYGKRNDRMPSFGKEHQLTPREISLLTDWIRGEWATAEPVASVKR